MHRAYREGAMAMSDVKYLEELDRAICTCDELLRVSRAQEIALADDSMDRFNDLIERRSQLISSLDLKAIGFNVRTVGGVANAHDISAKRSLILEKMRDLLRIDEANRKVLEARMAQAKTELATMARGRRALREYTYLNPHTESLYVDRRR